MRPVLIDLGFLQISTYGLCVALGYLAGILWLKRQNDARIIPGLDEDRFWLLIYALFFGAIMGGKLLYVVVELDNFLTGRYHFFRDFRWGFVFYGGFFGAALMGLLVYRRLKFDYAAVADYFGVALPMGHWFGRLGCLAAGCCYGKPTAAPWGISFSTEVESGVPRALRGIGLHPTQLYESAAVLAVWLFLHLKVLPLVQKRKLRAGTVFVGYIGLYSVARFAIEFFRGDQRGGTVLGMFVSQWIALAAMGICAAWVWLRGLKPGRR